jgi:lauroyl/myristoyl acyltransferase
LLSWALGPVILLIPRRRRTVYSNLHHAFPGRPRAWHTRIARKSCRRLIETSMLSLASPWLSVARIRQLGQFSRSMVAAINRRADEGAQPTPAIAAGPHLAYWETQTWLGLFTDYQCETGIVFRPLKNKKLNDWIKETRERHGMKLFSRRDGLMEVFRVLRRRGMVGILFDQNAGNPGALTTLLGRVCSTSEFPGMLVEKYGACLVILYARRLRFWRVRFELVNIATGGSAVDATIALNRWLENALATDEGLCASWLWSHARWKAQSNPASRFRLDTKHDFLNADLAARGWTRDTMPRRTRIWLRMPDDPAHHAHLFPLLRALRRSRPDTELTLFADTNALPALEPLRVERIADILRSLPPTLRQFRTLRREYPDVFVNLSETSRSDCEAKLTRSPQRFGIVRAGQRRSKLTDVYEVPAGADSPAENYKNFFKRFGLPDAT